MELLKLQQLVENQNKMKDLIELLKSKKEEFEMDNAVLIGSIKEKDEEENILKSELKIQALCEFRDTQNKKLLGGIGIRVGTKLQYEEKDAIVWATENMPVAIKSIIDKKMFEGFAKGAELDFVEKEENVSVTFPKEIKL